MTVPALLAELRTRDIHVWADGDRLQCNAPAAALTSELRDQLQQRKHEILAFLRGPAELSFAQQRLWFLDRLESGGGAYIISGALELNGVLDSAALERAAAALVERHEALRTVFVEVEGEPRQVVREAGGWALAVTDLTGQPRERLKACLRVEAARGFDLAQGPLFRAHLYRLAPDTHVLLLAMHHIVSDGWSMGVLIRELGELYRGFLQGAPATLTPLRVQYRDFARWQRGWLKGEVLERELAHWRGRLAGAPQVLELPTDRARPALESHRGAFYTFSLPRELVDRLRELSRREGATLFMTLLAGFALLLSRYSNQPDLLIGTPVANRNRAEIEPLIGFFVNTLVLRADATGEPSVREFIARMRETCLEAYAHQDLPFERLVEELHPVRDLSRNAVFQVVFALQNAPHGALELPGLTLKPVETGAEAAPFDLSLLTWETPEGLTARFSYATDLFDESTVARMGAHWRALLEAMVAAPERRVAELPLLTDAERRRLLVEWNDTKVDYPAARCVHEWVEEVARRRPKAQAVQCGTASLSYGELETRAEALAARLTERGVAAGALVAVYLERSVEMVVALLAVWKAGAAYVPIDPQYPAERVRFMLEDTQAAAVVTQGSLAGALPATGAAIVSVDAREVVRAPKRRAKQAPASPQSLAYVIYTSGSTGQPKGVEITHASLCNLIGWHQRAYEISPSDRATQIAGPAFDASVWELWPYLTAGASVHLPDEATRLNPSALVRWLVAERITVSFLPTPLAEAALRESWPKSTALRVLLTGGDRLNQRPAQKLPFRLINHYGPTENTVVSTCAEVQLATRGAPPIGRPLPNTRAYVVDARLQPVPVGVPGELLVGGVQLAAGYWKRPELTEEKFVPDPFTPGGRLYRTGDLVRYRADGNIEFLGRIDTQVKVRGFRIELGEIESGLGSHPAVKETVVLAREDTPGEKRLVAYVVGKTEAPSAAALKEHLAGRLPSYMVPTHFVMLETLPLTENGKVDRRALPAPEGSGLETAYVAPRNATEEKLARIWAEVLKVERVGVHDNFFELGGHSLLAVTLIERMRRAGLHADVRALFTTSTLAELAQAVGRESGLVEVPPNRIPAGCEAITPDMLPLAKLAPEEIACIAARVPGGARNIQDIYPLAPLQEGILFHHLMAREGDPYLLHGLAAFDTRARLDGYLRALQAVIDRHDILRTAVLSEGLAEPVQVVWRKALLKVEEVSLDHGDGDVAQQLHARYDPRRYRLDIAEAPLLRLFIAEDRANGRWVMLLLYHHLAIDHTASDVVQQEVHAYLLGQAEKLPAPLPFRNFVAQARLGVKREEHEAYFRELLGDVEEPTAPYGLIDVQGEGTGITEARQAMAPQLAKRLRERARSLGVSAAALCHLAYGQVLARTSGREDVVFGTVLFGRMQGGEGAERALGLFINTLPVRIRVGEASVEESVRSTHAQLAQLLRHEHASLALAQRMSAVAAPAPLFSSLLNYRHSAAATQVSAEARRAGEGISHLGGEERTNYPLVVMVDDLGEGFGLTAQAQSPIDPQRICGYLQRALEELVVALERSPTAPVRELDVLPARERDQLLSGWNRGLSYAKGALLHERFEAQAARTPGAVAVVFEGERVSYGELNARANRLAHRLRELGVVPDQLVGLRVERGVEMVVGLLGILKAGGAYLPLDPAYPKERIAFMLEDSAVGIVLTQMALLPDLAGLAVRTVLLEEPLAGPETNPAPLAGADNLAYVIYTSGSTGKPKGAQITHYNVTRLFEATEAWYRFNQDDVWTLFHSYAFDFSVWELWGALLYGGRVVIVPYMTSRAPEEFRELLIRERVTVLNQTPSAFRQLMQADLARPKADYALRTVIFGGEALELQSLRPWFERYGDERPLLVNMYGITETTVHVTYRPIRQADLDAGQGSVIGEPIPDLRLYILDAHQEPTPIGVPGEMYVGGAGVARGYLNREELTAQRFVSDPFTPNGARLYRTGDLARRLANGDIEYLGRIDSQVKIRGFRIELGEIESALGSHPAVREAVVLAREDTPGDKRLVAYVVSAEPPADAEALRAHIRTALPEYMVPAHFVTLEALPLTENGKVDRKALPAPEHSGSEAEYVAPRNATEESLAQIWAEVLKLERVGIHDNFFELGGHSLLAVTLIERMRRAGLNADVRALFATPTVAELALAAGGESGEVEVPPNRIPSGCQAITPEMLPLVTLTPEEIGRIVEAVPGGAKNVQDIYPLAPLQEGILFHHLMAREGDPYLLCSLMAFDNRARVDEFLKAMQAVIDRHDILRTAVLWEGLAEPVQVVWRKALLKAEEVHLDPAQGDIAQQLRARYDPRRYRIDVREAPLMRVFIARDRANGRWIALNLHHHLVDDNTSLKILFAEVRAHLQGQEATLPAPLPFRNFVAQARLGVKREEHEAYFKELLGDVEEPTAPFGLADVQGDASGVTEAHLPVDTRLEKRLREKARALGVSAASLCHLAYAQVLARIAGRDDVVFGTVLFGRMQGGEGIDRVLGMFINTLPVRIRVDEAGVEEAVKSTHAQLAQLLRHEHASLALAQRCSAVAAPAPLFSSLLNYRHSGETAQALTAEAWEVWEGIRLLSGETRTTYPFYVAVDDFGEGLTLTAQTLAPADPGRLCGYMHTALEQLVAALESAPGTPLHGLDVLPEPERRRLLVEWNSTAVDYPREVTVRELFEAQAGRTPDAVAVVFEGQGLSYAELNRQANRLAHRLRALGVAGEHVVGLRIDRSVEMVIGILGILKAGGAYLPLDPAHPADRVAFMLEDAGAALVVTQGSLAADLDGIAVTCVLVEEPLPGVETNPAAVASAENLAYVIYTSGSTGKPKGVAVEHRQLANYVRGVVERMESPSGANFAMVSTIAADLGNTVVFPALCFGGCLHVISSDRASDPAAFAEYCERHRIDCLKIVPSHFAALLSAPHPRKVMPRKQLILGGEASRCDWISSLRELAPECVIVNHYGPTETTVGVLTYRIGKDLPRTVSGTVPLGRPLPNSRMYILDQRMRPVPIGVAGELYIGGKGVARGYVGRPELTAERFLWVPFSEAPGARMYRTGDRVRYLPDGNIEFLGRIDDQVKIRGFRIELGEIEAVLGRHPASRGAAVLAREDSPGDKRLVAYVVADAGQTQLVEELRALLKAELPDYMVPSAFVVLEQLPLTPNGKVDRKALPVPDTAAYASGSYEAPLGEVEEKLAAIWAEVLKLERVGRHDNFFELGGHSLLAITLIERMRRAGMHADVRAIFTSPTLAELAKAVAGDIAGIETPPNRIPAGCEAITPEMLTLVTLTPEEIARVVAAVPAGARNIQDIYPLAPLQEGIFYHHLTARASDPYQQRALLSFDSRGPLDSFVEALQRVIERHDVLRTSMAWEGLDEPVQVVWRTARLKAEEVRLNPEDGDIAEQLRARFDARRYRLDVREAPLMRAFIAEDPAHARWVMVLLFHHLVVDHVTLEMLLEEIRAFVLDQAAGLPAPLPFRNFVAQARLGVKREEHEAYFKHLLADVEEPTAPFGLTDVQGDGSDITEVRQAVDVELARRLRARARALGVSAASLCHLAYAQVLARTSGRDDVVFGTVLFGRMQGGEGAERVLGLFINTLPVRIPVDGEGVEAGVRGVHAQLAQLLRHEHAPLALAQRASSISAPVPLFTALLNYRHMASEERPLPGIQLLEGEERTNYPLVLSVEDLGEGFALTAQTQSPLDPRRVCTYMHAALEQLVGALEKAPASPLRSLDILPAPERRQLLLEWNKTQTDYPREALIAELFEAQVKRTPDAVALEYEGETLTYKELNARANRLARYLAKQGVTRETLVGLCVERGLEMVVATLAIVKAGGTYVPLDPEYPQERLRFMLEDTGAPVLLTQARLRERLPAYAGKVIEVDSDWKKIARESALNPKALATAESLAYVIYTSGSTGTPKGVQVTHRGVTRLVCNTDYIDIQPTDRFAQASVVSFDAATFEIWGALLHGARVVGVSREVALSPRDFAQFLRERGITVLFLTTALFNQMAREAPGAFSPLRYVLFGGELVDPGAVRMVLREGAPRNLLHVYGPTEVTTYSTWHRVSELDQAATTVPIGRPIANTTAYVLDERREPVPVGVPGELYLGGDGVARGYLNRPELTAERFVENPFGKEPGARLYRTGDWVRYLPDGAIEFIGRRDSQVKVRGFRIELGEIEAALVRLPPVQEAVVLAREDTPGDKRVVAYVVAKEGQAEALGEWRSLLKQRLPDYMVPAHLMLLEALPLTPNGKVDRKALPAPERSGLEAAYVAPRNAAEEKLAQIWAEVLKVERVSIHDNFFELGGHSLLAVTLIERMRRAGLHADVRALLTSPTVAGFAAATEKIEIVL